MTLVTRSLAATLSAVGAEVTPVTRDKPPHHYPHPTQGTRHPTLYTQAHNANALGETQLAIVVLGIKWGVSPLDGGR